MNPKFNSIAIIRILVVITLLVGLLHWSSQTAMATTQIDIHGPNGSVQFGSKVAVLPNGNFVVVDSSFKIGNQTNVGAVYLYDGASGTMISMLTGTTSNDQVGSGGVTVLNNGNYVVSSPYWDNGAATDAGAFTWGSEANGITGTISAANSLVGSTANDLVGLDFGSVTPLSNGNYVVSYYSWDNGDVKDVGAVTWGSGTSGITGTISALNSLVGSTSGDWVGFGVTPLSNGNYVVSSEEWYNGTGAVTWGSGTSGVKGMVSSANSLVGSTTGDWVGFGVTPLSNGNFVVSSPNWSNGAAAYAGAVTWGNGTSGISGPITALNSLVGSTSGDGIGFGVTPLSNGNYVVSSSSWHNGAVSEAGAVTWGNGTSGVTGAVSAANSLVGSTYGDVSDMGVTPLSNGNYVVSNQRWDNGAVVDTGAVTWGNGASGISGPITATNSLVGSTANDWVGYGGVTALANGNYVVGSEYWDNGAVVNAGAATWGNGAVGVTGVVSITNSLVGSKAADLVGDSGVTPLSNGDYVVSSPYWDNGAVGDYGAVTWGNGTSGISGAISASNSLVGSTASDYVGYGGVTPLANGNYVVSSFLWDNGAVLDTGAVTWGNGTTGISGPITAANSLVGSTANDYVGLSGVTPLSNGNYVVDNPYWDSGAVVDTGAVTWGNGTSGISGAISAANSLVGSTAVDYVGYGGVTALANGDYVVNSPYWNNGATWEAGAITWSFGASGIIGTITAENSVSSTTAGGGVFMVFQYDPINNQLVVGRPVDNIVTLFNKKTLPGTFDKSSPTDGTTGISTSPTLAWGTSAEATSYEYCYDTTNDNACASWINNGTATSAELSGLSLSTTYYWQVRAVNADGSTYADDGTWWSFTTGSSNGSFAKSSPADGASGISTSPIFSWDISAGATGYEYCYDTTDDEACTSSWINNGTATSADLSGLKGGTTYYWQVRAVNGEAPIYANNGTWWSFTTAPYINYLSLAIK